MDLTAKTEAEPMTRQPIHTRSVNCHGYLRTDGLWDIEGELVDRKHYDSMGAERVHRAAGTPIHSMTICLTVDEHMLVRGARSEMRATPFPECQPAQAPLERLIGLKLGAGWRVAIDNAMGGVAGCTHYRELLFALATVAYQTIPRYRTHERQMRGIPEQTASAPPPHFGRCMGWDFDGAVMRRLRPEFAGWRQGTPRPASACTTLPATTNACHHTTIKKEDR